MIPAHQDVLVTFIESYFEDIQNFNSITNEGKALYLRMAVTHRRQDFQQFLALLSKPLLTAEAKKDHLELINILKKINEHCFNCLITIYNGTRMPALQFLLSGLNPVFDEIEVSNFIKKTVMDRVDMFEDEDVAKQADYTFLGEQLGEVQLLILQAIQQGKYRGDSIYEAPPNKLTQFIYINRPSCIQAFRSAAPFCTLEYLTKLPYARLEYMSKPGFIQALQAQKPVYTPYTLNKITMLGLKIISQRECFQTWSSPNPIYTLRDLLNFPVNMGFFSRSAWRNPEFIHIMLTQRPIVVRPEHIAALGFVEIRYILRKEIIQAMLPKAPLFTLFELVELIQNLSEKCRLALTEYNNICANDDVFHAILIGKDPAQLIYNQPGFFKVTDILSIIEARRHSGNHPALLEYTQNEDDNIGSKNSMIEEINNENINFPTMRETYSSDSSPSLWAAKIYLALATFIFVTLVIIDFIRGLLSASSSPLNFINLMNHVINLMLISICSPLLFIFAIACITGDPDKKTTPAPAYPYSFKNYLCSFFDNAPEDEVNLIAHNLAMENV